MYGVCVWVCVWGVYVYELCMYEVCVYGCVYEMCVCAHTQTHAHRHTYRHTYKHTYTQIETQKETRGHSCSMHGNGWEKCGQTKELHRGMVETFGLENGFLIYHTQVNQVNTHMHAQGDTHTESMQMHTHRDMHIDTFILHTHKHTQMQKETQKETCGYSSIVCLS